MLRIIYAFAQRREAPQSRLLSPSFSREEISWRNAANKFKTTPYIRYERCDTNSRKQFARISNNFARAERTLRCASRETPLRFRSMNGLTRVLIA